jgi:hypothetical protein
MPEDEAIESDPPEDYGYDLAHEVPTGADRRKPHPAYQQPGAHATPDAYTDYSSDEAHDL